MTDIAVVVPTIREDCAERFSAEWAAELAGARLIFVEDNPEPGFSVKADEHYSWRDIDAAFGSDSWVIPRRTSACRSFGIFKAWQGGADIIWTLDDDCYPEESRQGGYLPWLSQHFGTSVPQDAWHNTIASSGMYPRGFPYGIRDSRRPVMLHHGLWSEVPDFDGMTQQANPDFRLAPAEGTEVIPPGKFFPLCIMNVAFRRELAPAMYMLLMGQDPGGRRWGFDRFDDIWAGLFVKKICDHLGWAITSGAPSVRHSKASRAEANIQLEAAGVKAHEGFWPYIKRVQLTEATVAGCYLELANAVTRFSKAEYWQHLGSAMWHWAGLFEEADVAHA